MVKEAATSTSGIIQGIIVQIQGVGGQKIPKLCISLEKMIPVAKRNKKVDLTPPTNPQTPTSAAAKTTPRKKQQNLENFIRTNNELLQLYVVQTEI